MGSLRRVVIFGLPFSPNVGDGVIADCLAYAFSQQMPGVSIRHIDLAGRSAQGNVVVRRGMALRLLSRMPLRLRRVVVSLALRRLLRRLAPEWARRVAGADVVLFGGGQILSDVDLNFPLKLAAAALIAKSAGVPVGIVSAGVAGNWTRQGTALFGALAEAELRHVALRDAGSIAHWTAQMPQTGLSLPVLCRDPGLLAAACYGLAGPDGRGLPPPDDAPVGIGISDPAELALHADQGIGNSAAMLLGYVDLVLTVAARSKRVRLFCNGADADATFMARVCADPRLAALRAAGRVETAARPVTGADLARIIAGCEAVVAHRLHACILAYALGRPVLGLAWDGKLEGFLESVGLQHCLVDLADGAGQIVRRLEDTMSDGIAAEQCDRARAECIAQLAAVLAAFGRG